MAEGKNKIIVYKDWIKKFEALKDAEAGKLIKHFFRYVNDLNPVAPDRITELSFIDIEQTLKRDLKKWESFVEKQSENGKKGGRPENPKEPKESQITQALNNKPKKAVIDNVIVIDNVSTIQNIDIDFDLKLPEQKIENAIEYLSRTRKTEADRDLVLTLWTAFKEKNFTGEKFYKSEAKIFGHFFETLKFEKINGHSITSTKPGTSEARNNAVTKW
jgi:hypothetical protein